MSDLFDRLIAKAQGAGSVLRPRTPSMFEGGGDSRLVEEADAHVISREAGSENESRPDVPPPVASPRTPRDARLDPPHDPGDAAPLPPHGEPAMARVAAVPPAATQGDGSRASRRADAAMTGRPLPRAIHAADRPSSPAPAPAAPQVHVSIGRVEVRAVMPPAESAPRPARRPSPALSLDDYLKGGRR